MASPLTPKPAADWVEYNGGWVPPDHPLAKSPQTANVPAPVIPGTGGTKTLPQLPGITPAPTTPKVTATQPAASTPSPGAGWVQYNGGWVPSTHPLITGVADPTAKAQTTAQPFQLPQAAFPQPGIVSMPTGGGEATEGQNVPSVVSTLPLSSLPYLSSLKGFEHTKLGDPNHTTIKYQLGRLFAQYPPTPEGMAALIRNPEFQKLGVQSVGGGNLRLPSGEIIDAIQGFQSGGGAWQFNLKSNEQAPAPGGQNTSPGGATVPGAGSAGYSWNGTTWVDNATGYSWNGSAWVPAAGGAGAYVPGMGQTAVGDYNIPGYGSEVTSSEFTDPTTANLESLLNWRINELINPVEDPARQQYADLLQQYIQSLSQTDPAITNLVGSLESQAKNYLTPSAYETIGNEEISRLAGLDPQYQEAANKRLSQLEADPYTGAEWEMYRTGVLDPIERDRKAAQDRAMAEISQRGIDPSSGIAQQMLLEVNRQFDQARAQEQGTLGRARVEQRMARQGEAFDVQTAMDELLNSRRTQRTSLAQNLADWTANRGERAAQLYGTLAEIPTARAQQQLQGAQTLEGLSSSVRSEEQQRRAEALALQGLLAELPERRLQLALATLGQGSTPESMLGSLTNLAQLGNQSAAVKAQQSQANWTGLGSLASILGQLFQPKTATTGG